MSEITILPSGEKITVDPDSTLLEMLRAENIYVKSSCGGVASCSDCIVKIASGEDQLSAPPFEEIKLLGNVFHITKERLACQCKVIGNITIDISAHDEGKDQEKLRQKKPMNKKNIIRRTKKDRDEEKSIQVENPVEKKDRPEKQGGFYRPKEKKY